MTAYLLISTIIMWLLFSTWSSKNGINTFVKFIFLVTALYGSFMCLTVFGYIIHK